MGSRYIGVDQSGNGPVRRAGILFFTTLINVLTKSEVTDCTNGFRAIRDSMIDNLTLTEERFSAPELIIEARKNGMHIKEHPITVKKRQAGDTKKPQLGYAVGLMRTIYTSFLRRRLLILLRGSCRVKEDKGTAAAVPDTNDSARCIWIGIGRSEPAPIGSLA